MYEDLEKQQKTGNIYIAHKQDRIDQAMEKFMNNYPEKNELRILFLRESEGVYQFGSRRVHIKIEKGNKIMVRVGGGYMSINSFVNIFTESEVSKIMRKNDVLKRF